jgi:hypothetical protein
MLPVSQSAPANAPAAAPPQSGELASKAYAGGLIVAIMAGIGALLA